METTPRIVKRYANRKLYDTQDSRYVTLDQIAEMIRASEDVKVIDNSTKEDLTSVTLAQIIFEEEKRQRSFLPLSALRKVIQTGGDSLHNFVAQVQSSTGRVFRRDEEKAEGEVSIMEEGGEQREPMKTLRELVDSVQHTVDDWQQRIDVNVQSALESVSSVSLQTEIQSLRERLGDFERMLWRRDAKPSAEDGAEASEEKASEEKVSEEKASEEKVSEEKVSEEKAL
ncbi:MAG: polyhydroxyalkanoate synthesis regulator DNA-binding domain-containing protein [Deltaproteobacteria bacterium]|nr:polyhydroxyalkanoate synthesis regulator DNA-binding domain-containing protein [Deltaproteobacteria bacterium]